MLVKKFDHEIGWYEVEEKEVEINLKTTFTKIGDLIYFVGSK